MFELLRRVLSQIKNRWDKLQCRTGHQYASLLNRRRYFAAMGDDCYVDFSVNVEEPYLVSMGDNVWLTDDVRLLTHDGSLSMLSRARGSVLRKFGAIRFGSNVFVGMNATIMPGVRIGDDSIVAAGAVVTRDVESGTIVGGNPALPIGQVDDFWNRWSSRQAPFAYSGRHDKIRILTNAMKEELL
ncbi:MAG: acyltransferase [bacterium]|nr:acyltransferase [bacterium]